MIPMFYRWIAIISLIVVAIMLLVLQGSARFAPNSDPITLRYTTGGTLHQIKVDIRTGSLIVEDYVSLTDVDLSPNARYRVRSELVGSETHYILEHVDSGFTMTLDIVSRRFPESPRVYNRFWSTDSASMWFLLLYDNEYTELVGIDAETGERIGSITTDYVDEQPQLSSDQRLLMREQCQDCATTPNFFEAIVIDLRTEAMLPVADTPTYEHVFSPDGTWLSYTTISEGEAFHIVIDDLESDVEHIVTSPYQYTDLNWSPNSRYVLVDDRTGEGYLLLDVETGERTRLNLEDNGTPVWAARRGNFFLMQGINATISDVYSPDIGAFVPVPRELSARGGYEWGLSPDGRYISFRKDAGAITIYDTQTGNEWDAWHVDDEGWRIFKTLWEEVD